MSDSTATHVADNAPYSTLEVHSGRFVEYDGGAAPTVRPTSYSEKMMSNDNNDQKQVVVGEIPLPETVVTPPPEVQQPAQPKILGMKRKTFFVVLAAALIAVIAAAVGGGVGGAMASRKTKGSSLGSNNSTSTSNSTTKALYANTGLAAMQWTDPNGTLYKRVYYQDIDNKIRESAWDNSTAFDLPWQINAISDPAKPGTPISAVAGWPHASYNYSLVTELLSRIS